MWGVVKLTACCVAILQLGKSAISELGLKMLNDRQHVREYLSRGTTLINNDFQLPPVIQLRVLSFRCIALGCRDPENRLEGRLIMPTTLRLHGYEATDIHRYIELLIHNLVNIKDTTGRFLLKLDDGRIIDTKGRTSATS